MRRVEQSGKRDKSDWMSGATCGGRRSGCGGTISGGASARRITIIVSANTGRKTSRCVPTASHNDYLNLLADWGAAGGIIVLAGMAVFAAGLLKTWRHVRRRKMISAAGRAIASPFFSAPSAGLLALAVHSAGGFQSAHPGQRDARRDVAGVVEQQSAVCDGALLAGRAAAGENAD